MKAKEALIAALKALREALAALEAEPAYHDKVGYFRHHQQSLRALALSLEHLVEELGK